MAKNIVICCDGTSNRFGLTKTNVVKLCQAVEADAARQVVIYDPGVGTSGDSASMTALGKEITRVFGLAFGRGLFAKVEHGYGALMGCYEPGDRIFLFGFSRGAYTARVIAALVHLFGVLRRGNEHQIEHIMRLAARGEKLSFGEFLAVAAEYQATFGQATRVHFVGVWDTVKSVMTLRGDFSMPFTTKNPSIVHARHAVAIDERRAYFRQHLMQPAEGQDLQELWFPGTHCDVGGGYPDDEAGLSRGALAWMLREAEACGLLVDEARRRRAALGIASDGGGGPDPAGPIHESLKGFWRVLEVLPKRWYDRKGNPPRWRWRIYGGARRELPEGAKLHESVAARERALGGQRGAGVGAGAGSPGPSQF